MLRGDIVSGLVASQGTAPSTFWRDDILRALYHWQSATDAVAKVTRLDDGRDFRQVAALDRNGDTAAFTGAQSIPSAGHLTAHGQVVAGNMLSGPGILEAMAEAAKDVTGTPAARSDSRCDGRGGDSRGLQSAALLVLTPDQPPLDLRIDCSDEPIAALEQFWTRTQQSPYRDWLSEVPVITDKYR